MNRRILKDAIRQINIAREEAVESGEEFETSVGQPRKIEYIQDTLEIKNAGVENRRARRQERRQLRQNARTARREKIQEEGITSEWYFASGDLVTVKKSSKSSYGRPEAGTVAMVVDTVDYTDYNGQQINAALVTVMIDGRIEDWSAKWVKHCE